LTVSSSIYSLNGLPFEVDQITGGTPFEFLLTAVSLKNVKELEKDAQRIEERHTAGKLSDARHRDLQGIIDKARAGDWGTAERMAYEFRGAQPFFK
jgi:hypothetical protein